MHKSRTTSTPENLFSQGRADLQKCWRSILIMLSTAIPSLKDGIRDFQFIATDFLKCRTRSGKAVDSLSK